MNHAYRGLAGAVVALAALVATACARSTGPSGFDDAPPDPTVTLDASADGTAEYEGVSDGATIEGASSEGVAPDAALGSTGPDGASSDAGRGPPPDAASDDGPAVDGAGLAALAPNPAPGELLITEIMFEPSGEEPLSEWFEVYNAAGAPRLVSGLTIEDGYPHSHVVAADPPVIIAAGAYALLVRSAAVARANAIPADSILYDYGGGSPVDEGILLANGSSGDLSIWSGTVLVADVPYGPWLLGWPGASIELVSLRSAAGDQQDSWCAAGWAWAAGSDYGTPGFANDCP